MEITLIVLGVLIFIIFQSDSELCYCIGGPSRK